MAKKKYFIKDEDGLFTVTDEFFNDIKTRTEALVFAMRSLDELHNTLKEEALEQDTMLVGSIKVTTGLQRSIDELNKRWPGLLEQIYSVSRVVDGHLIAIN